MEDADVPWGTSLLLAGRLKTGDVEVTLVKEGGHRLSEPEDLKRLCGTLEELLHHMENGRPERPPAG